MPVIQSQGSGYYNYYNISSRYQCEAPLEAWYKKDLTKEEIVSNNSGILNKDSKNADLCRKLEDAYAGIAASNRGRYSTVEELRTALYEKYSAWGSYKDYSKEERNAMYLNELSMTCFGTIGAHTGMGGGDIYADPHLQGKVSKNEDTGNRKFNQSVLAVQIGNVFRNNYVDMSLFGNTRFSFAVDGMTKKLTVSIVQEDGEHPVSDLLLKQMEDALNTNGNAESLFYNLLYDSNHEGYVPKNIRTKYLLFNNFLMETGLDIRQFTQTEDGFVDADGRYARDIYKEALKNSSNVPGEFKGAAYDYYLSLEEAAMAEDFSKVPDLILGMEYQNGTVIMRNTDSRFEARA